MSGDTAKSLVPIATAAAGYALAPTLGISATMGTLAGAAAGTVAAGAMPSEAEKAAAPAAPKIEPVTPMPVADDSAVQAAKKKSIAAQIARRGRASTVLTDLGGREKLGA